VASEWLVMGGCKRNTSRYMTSLPKALPKGNYQQEHKQRLESEKCNKGRPNVPNSPMPSASEQVRQRGQTEREKAKKGEVKPLSGDQRRGARTVHREFSN